MYALVMIIGLILIFMSIRTFKVESNKNDSFNFKETMNNTKENINDYDIKINELRQESAVTITELQKSIVKLEERIRILEGANKNVQGVYSDIKINSKKQDKPKEVNAHHEEKSIDKEKKSSNMVKVDKIKELLEQGKTAEEVAEILKIGKGEVLLIKDLYIK